MDTIRIAYLLLAHTCQAQINSFVHQLLDYGECDVYIHVDKKHSDILPEIQQNEHVFVYSEFAVNWGGIEIPLAALFLMKKALASGNQYSHMYFGSCQDMLVKQGLYEYLCEHRQNLFITIGSPIELPSRSVACFQVRWPKKLLVRDNLHPYRLVRFVIQWLCTKGIIFRKNTKQLPNDMVIWGGRTWFIFPVDAICYIVDFIDNHSNYVDFWRESLASDLMFFQTIIMNSPLKDRVCNELMYVHFGEKLSNNNHPVDISIEDDLAIESGTYFCARKFNYADADVVNYYLKKTRK